MLIIKLLTLICLQHNHNYNYIRIKTLIVFATIYSFMSAQTKLSLTTTHILFIHTWLLLSSPKLCKD